MLKFTSGPSSRRDSCPGAEEGFLSVKAHDFGLHFKTSSLTTLTNFIEDDNAGESTPMHVDVSNFMLILQVRQLSKRLFYRKTVIEIDCHHHGPTGRMI